VHTIITRGNVWTAEREEKLQTLGRKLGLKIVESKLNERSTEHKQYERVNSIQIKLKRTEKEYVLPPCWFKDLKFYSNIF